MLNLAGKTAKEKANLKAKEIAKQDFSAEHFDSRYGVKIKIESIKEIDGGVEVFARAWKDGKQLGFGPDGTVDIERHLIYNPPIFVHDTTGDIEATYKIGPDGATEKRWLREDPKAALLSVLAHTVTLGGKEGSNIIKDKVGHTDTNIFASTADAWWYNNNATSWAAVRTDTASDDFGSGDANNTILAQTGWTIMRQAWPFDTSVIGSDTISSATLSLCSYTGSSASPDGLDIDIVSCSPDNPAAMDADDYDQFGSTVYGSLAMTEWDTANQYEPITLNASGIAYINGSGTTVFGGITSADTDNSAPTGNNYVNLFMADDNTGGGGTDKDPKLFVVHSSSVDYPADLQTTATFALTGVNINVGVARSIVTQVTSFTLEGVNIVANIGRVLAAEVTAFILRGVDIVVTKKGWNSATKNTASWTNSSKNSASFTDTTKNSASWTDQTKN